MTLSKHQESWGHECPMRWTGYQRKLTKRGAVLCMGLFKLLTSSITTILSFPTSSTDTRMRSSFRSRSLGASSHRAPSLASRRFRNARSKTFLGFRQKIRHGYSKRSPRTVMEGFRVPLRLLASASAGRRPSIDSDFQSALGIAVNFPNPDRKAKQNAAHPPPIGPGFRSFGIRSQNFLETFSRL